MSWSVLYGLDVFAITVFLISYYRNCYSKGYAVDIWHAHLLLYILLPYMLMLPFMRNELNALVVGKDFAGVIVSIPSVFLISMAGYFMVFIGGRMWNIRLGAGIRARAEGLLKIVPRGSYMLMSSRNVMIVLSLLCFVSQLSLITLYFVSSGFGFDMREYTFVNPSLRPFTQISALCSIIMGMHCMARYFEKRERVLLVCALLLTCELLFSGSRTSVVTTYLNVAVCYMVWRRRRINLRRVAFIGPIFILIFLYLGSIRGGSMSLAEFFASLAVLALYGNSFCDLRDFAWVYNGWDGVLWAGKTYLAGLGTFLPRGASGFRSTWSFGVATDWTVGLDTQMHPGLRPGEFGEMFFNFGFMGVLLAGLIIGVIVKRVDLDVKEALGGARPSMIRAFASTTTLYLAFCVGTSLSFPALYALIGLYSLAWLGLRARAMMFPARIVTS